MLIEPENQTVTRFAPSPSGLLHLGHAYSALFAFKAGERFILRIEDIDKGRCRPEFDQAVLQDLAWLGLEWSGEVRRQSQHMADYQTSIDKLKDLGLLYPCFCTRKEIQAEIENASHAPHGPDGPLYPGICRGLRLDEQEERMNNKAPFALRLNMEKAMALAGELLWKDREKGEIIANPEIFGDVVLARKDTPTSYHLAVTVDDHLQGVTLVTRGKDLFAATHVHRLLQALLGLNVPEYHHHKLLKGEDGKRFAKRDKSLTLRSLRDEGKTLEDVLLMIKL
ncbi:MAG: tRNA glutamyl-Q(34) synthetase GluQRS [Alphaproteobacteria bacterium]|nr:tRNA glutamyl-Q(34) synthetase GluQRS [Rhodospirillales bacterium]MCW9045613.1 tRNA glutamyl-Q(34) synthetase GluQRS [Alphaproteobacteria bacterium]